VAECHEHNTNGENWLGIYSTAWPIFYRNSNSKGSKRNNGNTINAWSEDYQMWGDVGAIKMAFAQKNDHRGT
jgi:hypothetical protein